MDLSGSSSDLSDSSLILQIGPSSEILCIVIGDPLPHLPAVSADTYTALLSLMMISYPFWQYLDPYSSPYFVPSQEPAFRPISYLWTRFGPQDAISDPSPPTYYFCISGLSLVLFLLAPLTQQLYCTILTLLLTQSLQAPLSSLQP